MPKSPWERDTEDAARLSFWWWVIFGLVIATIFAWLVLLPQVIKMRQAAVDAQTQMQRQTLEYVTTQQQHELQLVAEATKQEPGSPTRIAIIARIRQDVAQMESKNVPPSVTKFLAEEPQ